jgi:putative redox protein
MAFVQASIGKTAYAVTIAAGRHGLTADESAALGGQDAGPAPYELLLSSLGACTAITLKMYADRKAWPLDGMKVGLRFIRKDDEQRIERTLTLEGGLDADQRARLADIAERTPVTLTLKAGLPIHTSLV